MAGTNTEDRMSGHSNQLSGLGDTPENEDGRETKQREEQDTVRRHEQEEQVLLHLQNARA